MSAPLRLVRYCVGSWQAGYRRYSPLGHPRLGVSFWWSVPPWACVYFHLFVLTGRGVSVTAEGSFSFDASLDTLDYTLSKMRNVVGVVDGGDRRQATGSRAPSTAVLPGLHPHPPEQGIYRQCQETRPDLQPNAGIAGRLSRCISSLFRRRWILGDKSPHRRDHVPYGVCAIFYTRPKCSAIVVVPLGKRIPSLSRQQRSHAQPGQPRAEEEREEKNVPSHRCGMPPWEDLLLALYPQEKGTGGKNSRRSWGLSLRGMSHREDGQSKEYIGPGLVQLPRPFCPCKSTVLDVGPFPFPSSVAAWPSVPRTFWLVKLR